MKKINVYINKGSGTNQDKSFDSIVWLHTKGYTEKGEIISSDTETLKTPSYEFIKSKPHKDASNNSLIRLNEKNGASWFSCLRGEKNVNEIAIWQMFLEKIAEYFHKEYSLLEYAPISLSLNKERIELDKLYIKKVISFLGQRLNNSEIVNDNEKNYADDIYGATLRMSITDGTGEAKPVLCRIFFRNRDDEKGIEPIISKEIGAINASIKSFEDDIPNEINTENFSRNETVSSIMNALDDLLNKEKGFQDYVNFEDERDKKVLEDIIRRGPDNIVPIICRTVDVIGVFHVKWSIRKYAVKINNKQSFDVSVGIGGRLSLSCKLCRDRKKIIDNNRIELTNKKAVYIHPEQDNLGLSDNDKQLLLDNNPMDRHAIEINCENGRFDEGICRRYVCQSELFDVNQELYDESISESERKTKLCKDCSNIEMVYKIGDNYYHTPQLAFCHDKMALTKQENIHYCKVCGRGYQLDLGQRGVCNFCKTILDKNNDESITNLYKKYAEMLPLGKRLLGIGKERRCNEDAEIIIFGIGEQVFLYNKSFNEGTTYIEPYKKYKIKKG